RAGGAPRPLPRELRAPAAARAQHADPVADPVTRPRSRVSEGAPLDGPGAIDLVPADRPQSAEIRPQHLPGDRGRLHPGDPPPLLLSGAGVASRAAHRAVTPRARRITGPLCVAPSFPGPVTGRPPPPSRGPGLHS